MNVLSLFDGISCGQIALNKLNIKYDNYYSSEIDKFSIKVTQYNYPNTIQLGDITYLDPSKLQNIDLLIGGSPCTSFSKAISNNTGFNGNSNLVFEYLRILHFLKPKYFLLENVNMKDEWKDIITSNIGVEPIIINSDKFSAQKRERLYWTNIKINDLSNIKNNSIVKDIIESNVDKKYFYDEDYEFYGDDKVVCAKVNVNGHDLLKRVNSIYHKCQTLTAVCGGNQQKKIIQNNKVRKLTPLEYERLQTIPDNYTKIVSDSHRYKMIGNAWTVDVISYILKNII